MIGLHVTTLGCKLNQLDSAELAGSLRNAARRVADPSQARLVVVNTCTVTAAADSDARQLLRRRRRESPEALIVATGCYAERDPEALRSLPEVDLVITREERARAPSLILDRLRALYPEEIADGCAERIVEDALPDFGGRSRASLRVQEGCDLRCSYCVIPRVRGESRSVPAAALADRLTRLLGAGYREVVLTGVNTGDYGKDLAPRTDLAALLRLLARAEGRYRLRLNSVEPRCVSDRLVDAIAGEPRVARHLQVPLQSGSDTVLRAMKRNYRVADYARALEILHRRVPGIGLGADVIVGFPGEAEAEFEQTVRFIRSTPLHYLHVFSFSPRPGTPAAGLSDRPSPEAIKRRSRRLRELGRDLSLEYRLSQTGRPLEALVLHGRDAAGRRRALTSNFIEVSLETEAAENTFQTVFLTGVDRDATRAAVQRAGSVR